ncbi:MAG TPA: MoaD/ThiS family protein [Anaerolineae bacterium]|nr:MoaD/ThiS family protein [Anaerolineae bacterium]
MLVQLHGTLRGGSGVRQIDVSLPDSATVGSVLAAAQAQEPRAEAVLLDSTGQLRQDLMILRNGRDIRWLQSMDTPLTALDRLDLFIQTGAQRAFAVD